MRQNDEMVDVFVSMIVIVEEEEDWEWRGGRRRWRDGRDGGGACAGAGRAGRVPDVALGESGSEVLSGCAPQESRTFVGVGSRPVRLNSSTKM